MVVDEHMNALFQNSRKWCLLWVLLCWRCFDLCSTHVM